MKKNQSDLPFVASRAQRWMNKLLPASRGHRSSPGLSVSKIQRVWMIQERPSATVDYIVGPSVAAFNVPVESHYLDELPSASPDMTGTLIVLVRYVNARWRSFIEKHSQNLAGVVYFMDDDLFDRAALNGLPAPYIKKIETLVLKHRSWLYVRSSEIWVSSAALATKYAAHRPRIIEWLPPRTILTRATPVRLFYHGSASHADEQRWLKEVVSSVLSRCENVHFEIIGDLSVNRMYRNLPRVTILHPMSWPNYLLFSRSSTRDIGLAPLLPSQFNASRGPTKFFDIARIGAVGIYSDVSPYATFIRDNVDGVLISNNPREWVDTIALLANDRPRIDRLAEAAYERALSYSDQVAFDVPNRGGIA